MAEKEDVVVAETMEKACLIFKRLSLQAGEDADVEDEAKGKQTISSRRNSNFLSSKSQQSTLNYSVRRLKEYVLKI